MRFRILPVLVAAGWCTILSGAFGLKSGLVVSIVLIACVFVSLQVPTVIVSKMFEDRLEGVALAVNFVVSAGLSSFYVLFVVGKYQLILLPQSLWLVMAFGTIAFVFWIHFIVLVADKGKGMQFASAMNMFSLVQELSLVWFVFRF